MPPRKWREDKHLNGNSQPWVSKLRTAFCVGHLAASERTSVMANKMELMNKQLESHVALRFRVRCFKKASERPCSLLKPVVACLVGSCHTPLEENL